MEGVDTAVPESLDKPPAKHARIWEPAGVQNLPPASSRGEFPNVPGFVGNPQTQHRMPPTPQPTSQELSRAFKGGNGVAWSQASKGGNGAAWSQASKGGNGAALEDVRRDAVDV